MNALILHNFMLQDVLGSVLAVLAFAMVLYAPGYLVAHLTDLFGFRRMPFAERSVWAIACSFAVAPIAAYLVGRIAGLKGLCWNLAGVAVVALVLLLTNSRRRWSRRERWITALLVCGWTAFALLLLVDFQIGHKLYFSVVMADQSYRIAFTDAVVRTGVPPANPLYFPGSPAPMHYYYFWYVLCAAVVKLAHVSSGQSFIASTIWAGFGLLVMVKLYTRHFFRWERKQRRIALGLLLITGAGLIPAVGQAILQPALNGDTEWWSVDPIDAWPDSLLWVPHHVASVLCCLFAFLLLWRTRESTSLRDRVSAIVLAALSFASAFGLSVYVAFGFALLMIAWLIRLIVRRDPERVATWRRVAMAAILSAAMLAPFLHELMSSYVPPHAANGAAPPAQATQVFSISVRRMIDSGMVTSLPVFAGWNRAHPVLLDQTIRLLLLLPGLAMELGLYGLVLVLLLVAQRRGTLPQDEARNTSLFFCICGLLMTLFVSSSVITNNDFGYRAVMLPQFFLLLLAADMLGSWWIPERPDVIAPTPRTRAWAYSLLALGAAGTIYWAFLLRAWLPIETHQVQNGFSQLPDDEFQIREAFNLLHHQAAPGAVVAFRPIDPTPDRKGEVMTPSEYYQRMLVMDTGRQILNAEEKCATHFGGASAPCPVIQNATKQLYGVPAPSAEWAREYCSRLGVQYLAISSRDPDWSSATGWPVTLPSVAQEPRFRILRCSEGQ